ncbi:MAG TPA: hypothetical protein VF157_04550 [Chloroflexota bacterium]
MLGSSLGLPVAAERPPEHSVSATPEPPAEAETGRFVPFASRLALRPPL